LAANATTFTAFAVALIVRPWWHALILVALIFAATTLNFVEGHQKGRRRA
jgi:hypothetical protein